MHARRLLIEAVSTKKLKQNPLYRSIYWGETVVIVAPTKHRPVLRIHATPLQKELWCFFTELNDIGAAIEHFSGKDFGIDPWDLLWSLSDLERKKVLVPVIENQCKGINWPNWKNQL